MVIFKIVLPIKTCVRWTEGPRKIKSIWINSSFEKNPKSYPSELRSTSLRSVEQMRVRKERKFKQEQMDAGWREGLCSLQPFSNFYAATDISVTHVNPCTCDVFTLESLWKCCNVLSSLSCLGPFNPSVNLQMP